MRCESLIVDDSSRNVVALFNVDTNCLAIIKMASIVGTGAVWVESQAKW